MPSDELKFYISRHIETLGQLEVLLLLYRTPTRSWRATEITQELRGTRESTLRWLGMWRTLGMVVSDKEHFRFQPSSPEQLRFVEGLAQLYQARPATVVQLIHARPNPQLEDFVRAFDLRKDK